jgi:hypothetical protein
METRPPDPIWGDLAALAAELLAKPDADAPDPPRRGEGDAEDQEGER